jgi:hypothetical protein
LFTGWLALKIDIHFPLVDLDCGLGVGLNNKVMLWTTGDWDVFHMGASLGIDFCLEAGRRKTRKGCRQKRGLGWAEGFACLQLKPVYRA